MIINKETTIHNNQFVLASMKEMQHEQVVFCNDKETGLKAIIAIHDTTLGPALGGTRMWNYDNEFNALQDVLRLSRGMSFKAAISGLDLGGGKAVIIGDSKTEKTKELMSKFGEFVDSLGGKYITAEDVGMNTKDMEYVRETTRYVTGVSEEMGGSGDPSPVTAYGVYMGMKASAKYKWGADSLKNKIILVQGVGHVGENLVEHLVKEGSHVIINDINEVQLEKVKRKYGVDVVVGDEVYDLDMDIYAPCALGATLNPITISRLRCTIIAGAANNQLFDENRDSELLSERNIIYAPDFLINAGGLINVYSEIKGYDREHALNQTKEIYNTTLEILRKAEIDCVTTHNAALSIAQQRIVNKRRGL